MFHIVFNADENYIKYSAVLINSIVKSVDKRKSFKDFFDAEVLNSSLGWGVDNFQNENLAIQAQQDNTQPREQAQAINLST